MDNVLLPTETELYIDSMAPQNLKNIGNKQWLEWHHRLQRLNQQALVEASQLKEESVKEILVSFQKTPVLVHEAILINIWKHKVLPQMLKLESNPSNTFVAYSILYHEAICVALLELVMYHESCCESLGDFAADLLDYSCGCASQLLTVKQQDAPSKESPKEELLRQKQNLTFDIGIRSLSIIRYLAGSLDKLTLSVCSRMYETHDIPTLFVQILSERPWIKDGNKQYSAGRWSNWDGEALSQPEGQIWLTLRHLLLDPACQTHYTLTATRRSQLNKLLALLTPVVLDQLSPLIELKQWLSHVCIADQPSAASKPILLETVLEIKLKILEEFEGKWKKLAKEQIPVVFTRDKKSLLEAAQLLNEAYNTDLLEKFEPKQKASCEQCGKSAIQRCSKCKKSWYCSRSCQVKHWPQHKEACLIDN